MEEGQTSAHLRAVLGEEAFVFLAQAFGGTRVYVPPKCRDDHEIVLAIGRVAADALSRSFAPDTIRVPLARRERALYFRGTLGLSNAQIARQLGITEGGVNRLFARQQDLPAKAILGKPPTQLTLL
ncbi:MAG: hypothetical protein K2W86_14790 [Sphingomonas sp.]|uniref:hypothetical protein n=1 Tax=Sphingomonas sp. TaxID=28214 RepID=UPI0035A8996C|nr:hypothetical protein [Sphingomonas sp.]